MIPTVPLDHPAFEPTRYWRGPAWGNIMWLIERALERQGEDELATAVRGGIIELVRTGGFSEHFDPTTGEGHGSSAFSWTAALVLDVLRLS